jgi:hypothetical protein
LAPQTDEGTPSARERIFALGEAIDGLIEGSSRSRASVSPWLEALAEFRQDVRDLIEADASLDSDDLREVCAELMAHFARFDPDTQSDDANPSELTRRSELHDAYANCLRVVCDICFGTGLGGTNGSGD